MVVCTLTYCQNIISADPFDLFIYEQEKFLGNDIQQSLLLRPFLNQSNNSRWSLVARNEFFINDNGPNLENMGNRWLGRGTGFFTGLNLSYSNKYISLSIEPYYYFDQNQFPCNGKITYSHESHKTHRAVL